MTPLLYILAGAGVYLLLSGRASALGSALGGALGGERSIADLVNLYQGKRMMDVPAADRERLRLHAKSLLEPYPPKVGPFGSPFLVPSNPSIGWIPDTGCDGGACVLVRRTSQRLTDLGDLYAPKSWTDTDPAIVLYRKSYAKGQQDWSPGGEVGRVTSTGGKLLGILGVKL